MPIHSADRLSSSLSILFGLQSLILRLLEIPNLGICQGFSLNPSKNCQILVMRYDWLDLGSKQNPLNPKLGAILA